MPHWELWLHLFWGELFHAPGGTTGVRKLVQAGCLNLVQKTGLTSNHAQWDSQWFYLHNDDGLFPTYTRQLVRERPENWKYGVIQTHQSRLRPLLNT
jgi:hypothetical protein